MYKQGWKLNVTSCATYSMCLCIYNYVTTPGWQTTRPTLLPLLENILLNFLLSLKQSDALPRPLFHRASFLQNFAFRQCTVSPGLQTPLWFRYTSKLAAVCITKIHSRLHGLWEHNKRAACCFLPPGSD